MPAGSRSTVFTIFCFAGFPDLQLDLILCGSNTPISQAVAMASIASVLAEGGIAVHAEALRWGKPAVALDFTVDTLLDAIVFH